MVPLERGVHVARGPADRALLAEHVPGLERLAELDLDVAEREAPVARKAELVVGAEPLRIEGEPRLLELGEHVGEVGPHEVGQHEAVVQGGAPAHQRRTVGCVPEAGDERAQE